MNANVIIRRGAAWLIDGNAGDRKPYGNRWRVGNEDRGHHFIQRERFFGMERASCESRLGHGRRRFRQCAKDNKLFDVKPGRGIMVNGTDGKPTSNLLSKRTSTATAIFISNSACPKDPIRASISKAYMRFRSSTAGEKKMLGFPTAAGIYARFKNGTNV